MSYIEKILYVFPAVACMFLMLGNILKASIGYSFLMLLYRLPIIEQYGVYVIGPSMLCLQTNLVIMMTVSLAASSYHLRKFYLLFLALFHWIHYALLNYEIFQDIRMIHNHYRIRRQMNTTWLLMIFIIILVIEAIEQKHISEQ